MIRRDGKKKNRGSCIILDLDDCLVHVYTEHPEMNSVIFKDPKYQRLRSYLFHITLVDEFNNKGKGVKDEHWGLKRPNLNIFLDFCFREFDVVAVWSAGTRNYVHAIVAEIFDGIGKPDIVYTRDNLNSRSSSDYDKPIQEILKDKRIKDRCDISKTFFIDDRRANFVSSPGNGIIIPPFSPPISNLLSGLNDIALLQLRQWLSRPEIISAPDVRKLEKSKIFTTKLDSNYTRVNPNIYNINPTLLATDSSYLSKRTASVPYVPFSILEQDSAYVRENKEEFDRFNRNIKELPLVTIEA